MEVPVICRLTRQIFIFAGFFGLLAIGIPYAGLPHSRNPRLDELVGSILMFFLFGIPTFLLIQAYLRCRLKADSHGLEIRGMFKTQFVEWNQIRDFYLELPPPDKKVKGTLAFIEYGSRKQMLSRNFDNLSALLEVIEAKANNARAKKFELRENRDLGEAPQIFDYGNPQIWPHILMAIGAGPVFFGLTLLKSASYSGFSGISNPFAIYTGMTKLLFITTNVFVFSLPGLLVLATLPMKRNLQKFRGQQIIASKSGLEWRKGADKIEMPWAQIRNYHFESIKGHLQGRLCVVESDRERITFLPDIPKGHILRSIIAQNARNADIDSWQYSRGSDSDVLGRNPTVASDGKLIFHYKTRSNRATLIFGIVLCIAGLLGYYFRDTPGMETDFTSLVIAVITGIPTFYGWLAYFFSRVEIERDGIRHITLFKRNFIQWNEIEKLKGGSSFAIISKRKTLRITQFIAEAAQFANIIAERSNMKWEKPEEKADFIIGH